MKIAICVSGICRGNAKENTERAKKIFNGDLFLSTWNGREGDMKKKGFKDYFTFDEPIMHYHPLIDVNIESYYPGPIFKTKYLINRAKNNSSYRERLLHQAKQILGHSFLLKQIPEEYDMIIRTRYDTFISDKADFKKWLDISYNEKKAIGFGLRHSRWNKIHEFKVIDHIWNFDGDEEISNDWGGYIPDQVVFHRRDMWNYELVDRLFYEKRLLGSERGWFQILSQPYGENHESIYGGAQLESLLNNSIIDLK